MPNIRYKRGPRLKKLKGLQHDVVLPTRMQFDYVELQTLKNIGHDQGGMEVGGSGNHFVRLHLSCQGTDHTSEVCLV